jgi:hypothetical protein
MRKPSRLVELDDIISNQVLGDDPEVIALVMRMHLALEAILIEHLRSFRSDDKIYKLSFPAKTELLEREGRITSADKQAFDKLNDFRNDFAHIFGHRVGISETLKLARELESCGVDFSDSIGHYSENDAAAYYDGLLGVLAEVGWCVLFHAAYRLNESGGRDIFAAR